MKLPYEKAALRGEEEADYQNNIEYTWKTLEMDKKKPRFEQEHNILAWLSLYYVSERG